MAGMKCAVAFVLILALVGCLDAAPAAHKKNSTDLPATHRSEASTVPPMMNSSSRSDVTDTSPEIKSSTVNALSSTTESEESQDQGQLKVDAANATTTSELADDDLTTKSKVLTSDEAQMKDGDQNPDGGQMNADADPKSSSAERLVPVISALCVAFFSLHSISKIAFA